MTYLTHTDRASGGVSIGQTLLHLKASLTQRWSQFRAYHRTLNELSGLSDHELSDIGVHRANIDAVARGFASRT
jgi:uncharacterized protein YjiS (DUF1127 family)